MASGGEDVRPKDPDRPLMKRCSNPQCRMLLSPNSKYCSECGRKVGQVEQQTAGPDFDSSQEEDVDGDGDQVVGPINLREYFEMPENRDGIVDRVKFVREQMTKLQRSVKEQLIKFTKFHKTGRKAIKLLNRMLSSIKTGNGKSLRDYFGELKYDTFIMTLQNVASLAESPVNHQLLLDWIEETVMVLVMMYRMGNDLASFLTAQDRDTAMASLQSRFQIFVSHVRNNGDLYQRTFLALAKLCTQDLVYNACSMLMAIYDNRENGLLLWIFENPMRAVGFIALLIAFLSAMWCAYLRYTRPKDEDEDD